MKKKHKIIIMILLLIVCVTGVGIGTSTEEYYAAGQWIDLGQGWRFRVDGPHVDGVGKWHVHVENQHTGVKGSEGVDGSASHGDHMNKIPNKIKKKIKEHDEYKKGQEEQKKLEEAEAKIKKQNLKIDWKHIGDVTLAIVIVIVCTGTFFFQGDDIVAWMNLLRAMGC